MDNSGLLMKYFVLKPKGRGTHARASRAAMRAYAAVVKQCNPELSDELHQWADNEFDLAMGGCSASRRSFAIQMETIPLAVKNAKNQS